MDQRAKEVLNRPATDLRLLTAKTKLGVVNYLTVNSSVTRLTKVIHRRYQESGDAEILDYSALPLAHVDEGSKKLISDLTAIHVIRTTRRDVLFTTNDCWFGMVEAFLRTNQDGEITRISRSERLPEIAFYPWSDDCPFINCQTTKPVWPPAVRKSPR